jgi:hypothetical protein
LRLDVRVRQPQSRARLNGQENVNSRITRGGQDDAMQRLRSDSLGYSIASCLAPTGSMRGNA